MPQPWSPRCCFEQHQKRMKRIRVNVDTEGLHTRWDARTNTRCTFFPKDNDTNKRAYIFQKTKRPKNSSSEILLWRLINSRTVRTSELLLFTGRSVQEFHFFHMKMCESISIYVREEKMQDGCFLLQLPACVCAASACPFAEHVHLLNIVDPIHRIVYFLPSWWKFYKEKQRKKTEWDWGNEQKKTQGCEVAGGYVLSH